MPVIPVGFQDWDFRTAGVPSHWKDGHTCHRWVPYGMPRFRNRRHAGNILSLPKNEKTGDLDGPCGTGVFVILPPINGPIPHAYAVTALHVIQCGASIIRLNKEVPNSRGDGQRLWGRVI